MEINAGDTAWVLGCGRARDVHDAGPRAVLRRHGPGARTCSTMLMQNFFCLGLVSVLWAVVVYSLAFGGTNKCIGNLDFAWMGTSTPRRRDSRSTIPPSLFMAYQMMFAVITPALITGAIADRMRFGAWVWFLGLWVDPRVRAGRALGVRAGGLAVPARRARLRGRHGRAHQRGHRRARGRAVIGRRRGWPGTPMPPHSLPLTLIGTGILWFGWFGFNAGLGAGGQRRSRCRRSSTRTWPRPRRCSAGSSSSASTRGHATTLGCGVGRGRGPGGDHAVRGIRRRDVADRDRPRSPARSVISR